MNVFPETEINEEKEIYEDILGKKILPRKRKREILETLLCYGSSLVATIQQMRKIIFYSRPQFRKEMKITVFIKNKIICIRCFTLHAFLAFFILS